MHQATRTQHARQHAGWQTQARKRGDEMVACNTCGMPHVQRFQAEPDERITPLRLLGLVVFALGMWGVLGGFVWIVMAGAA